jgi:hypothetical protein
VRTEEWTQDQEGMTATALVDVFEPGDRYDNRSNGDVVVLRLDVFEELAKGSGFQRAST